MYTRKDINMKYRFVAIALTITLLLLAGRPALARNATLLDNIYVYPYGERPTVLDSVLFVPLQTDLAFHGTMWVAEDRSNFSMFNIGEQGTVTRAKSAGSLWVHISVPIMPFVWSHKGYVHFVEFCARSTNGASTKPVKIDLYENGTKFSSQAITWPAVNTFQCVGIPFATGSWKQDLGISVQISYANNTDKVTLFKAWVRMGYD
jgi:hypothetical protein